MPMYYTILTDAGQVLLAEAMASGVPVILTQFAAGDGGGAPVTPDPAMTALVGEVYRGSISSLATNPDQPNAMISQLIIPKESGGYTVREVGLFTDDGTLFSIGNYPDQPKPPVDSGYAVKLDMRYVLVVSDISAITVVIPPGDYLTREEADTIYLAIGNNLSEIAANGTAAQQAARDNLALGTAATRDVTTSSLDPTPGRVTLVGDGGLLREALAVTDAQLTTPGGLVSMLFKQGGGGENDHFGGHGAGVHLMYGVSGDGTRAISTNTFVDHEGNHWSEYLEVDNETGAIVTERKQKQYGPFNPPPAQIVDAYTRAESDARFVQDVDQGAVIRTPQQSFTAPAGHSLVGIESHSGNYDTQIDAIISRPNQKKINGVWLPWSGAIVTMADGTDWIEYQKTLSDDTIKITYDDDGVIYSVVDSLVPERGGVYAASMLEPHGLYVAEFAPEDFPQDFTLDGTWTFAGGMFTYTEKDVTAKANPQQAQINELAKQIEEIQKTLVAKK